MTTDIRATQREKPFQSNDDSRSAPVYTRPVLVTLTHHIIVLYSNRNSLSGLQRYGYICNIPVELFGAFIFKGSRSIRANRLGCGRGRKGMWHVSVSGYATRRHRPIYSSPRPNTLTAPLALDA